MRISHERRPPTQHRRAGEFPAPRLLLVDDEPGLRTAVQAYLEDEGFDVTTAVDGEEGFTKAQQMLPDLVISDVMMPRLDGYGLLKLRADERLGGTPVIFLTAKGMTADRTQGYMAGVDDYIPKPFDPDELVARVRNVAQRQQRLLQEAARFADTDMGRWPSRSLKSAPCWPRRKPFHPKSLWCTASRRGRRVCCSWWLRA